MKIKPKLSIIIPVYNTENYLNECLLSVTSQQLKDIEIIIVNDGSTDRSSEIIRTYANADPRICIIDVDNGGQGRARNLAIEKVSGEYIGFVDSDDRIEPGMFRELFDLATSQNSDVSICEIAIDDAEKRQTRRYSWTEIPFPGEFDGKTFCYDDIGEQLFKLTPSPFNKIYRTEFVK